jgi:hypothetical protein
MNSIHDLYDICFDKVLEEQILYYQDPNPAWAGVNCGGFPCSAPNNIVLKITSFKKSTRSQIMFNIPNNPKWKVKSLKCIEPNLNINGDTSISSFLKNGVTLIPNKFTLSDCKIVNSWNGMICPSERDIGMVVIQSVEKEANTRTVAPVLVESYKDNFSNKVNGYMDHDCEVGYPSFKKTPVHGSLITFNKNYKITFTGSVPSPIKIMMFDHLYPLSPIKKAIFQIKYPQPQTIVVFKNGVEIKTKMWKPSEVIDLTSSSSMVCGDSKWTPVENILEFVVTNEKDCDLLLKQVNSLQMSIRLDITVEDFYSKGTGNQLIYNIAAILGIPIEQIRITGVGRGSSIAYTTILEKVPSSNDDVIPPPKETATSQINSNNDNSALKSNGKLDLSKSKSFILSSIDRGTLKMPAALLDIKSEVVSAIRTTEPINTSATNNNNPTTTLNNDSNTTQPTIPQPSNNNTIVQPSNNNSTTENPKVPETILPPTDIPKKDQAEEKDYSMLIIILSITIPLFIIVCGIIVFIIHRHNLKNSKHSPIPEKSKDNVSRSKIVNTENNLPRENIEA